MNEQDPVGDVASFLSNPPKPKRKGCAICKHPQREPIEKAIVYFQQCKNAKKTAMAWNTFMTQYLIPKYGELGRASVKGHMEKCHGTKIT